MNFKKFIKNIILITLVLITFPALIVFIVDPIQLYHDQITLKKVKYFKEQRHQNIGLINKFLVRGEDSYTIIIGTSMSENFIPSKVEEQLKDGTKVLKLAMSGGRPLEQYIILKKALDTGKVKRVIWDIHWYYFLENISQKDKNHDFPYKLYSDNILIQAYYYLFNEDYVKNAIRIFFGKVNRSHWTENLDKLNYTMNDWIKKSLFSKNISQKSILKMNEDISKIKDDIPSLDFIEKNFAKNIYYPSIDKYVLPILREYQNIKFDLYFPPYSTYFYAKASIDKAIRYIYARKYLVDKTKKFNNVTLCGFDNIYGIVNNMYNYKDYGHYRACINDYIMSSIIKNDNNITNLNINHYIEQMISNINSYSQIRFSKKYKMKNIKKSNIRTRQYKSNVIYKNGRFYISEQNFKKFSKIDFIFKKPLQADGILVEYKLPKEKLKMISCTLRSMNGWSHFFFKQNQLKTGKIILNKSTISKMSKEKKFSFDNIKSLTVRLYPIKAKQITNFIIYNIKTIKDKQCKF